MASVARDGGGDGDGQEIRLVTQGEVVLKESFEERG